MPQEFGGTLGPECLKTGFPLPTFPPPTLLYAKYNDKKNIKKQDDIQSIPIQYRVQVFVRRRMPIEHALPPRGCSGALAGSLGHVASLLFVFFKPSSMNIDWTFYFAHFLADLVAFLLNKLS